MKSFALITLTGLLAIPVFTASAQPTPQLIVEGNQWVVQLPPNTPVPQNIVLQLSAPSGAPAPNVTIQQPPVAQAPIAVTQPSTEVYVAEAPPPPPVEVVTVAPSPYHVWIGGHYEWTRRGYLWHAGHWERPPHHGSHWVAARWELRGGHYFYVEGRWER